jgi:DNA polymerase IV
MEKKVDRHKLYGVLLFDSFAAQVEAVYNPLLRGRPYVVVRQGCGSHKSAVWSASAPARGLGIAAGMPVRLVREKYRNVEIVRCNDAYHDVVRGELERLLRRYTPDVSVSRQGVCLLDLSRTPVGGSGRLERAVTDLRDDVSGATGLSRPAAGLAASGVVAGILARMALPDGMRICQNGAEAELLASVETRILPGFSQGCRERLRRYGLKTVGQVRAIAKSDLLARFGGEGERLYHVARGIDVKNVGAAFDGDAPVSVETVLERDTGDGDLLLQYLHRTVDRFCHAARVSRLAVRSVLLSITYTDRKCAQKTVRLPRETSEYQALVRRVETAFAGLYCRRVGIRSIAMSGRGTDGQGSGQLDLFEGGWDDKQGQLGRSIARVRERSGFDAVFTGRDYGAYVKALDYEKKC